MLTQSAPPLMPRSLSILLRPWRRLGRVNLNGKANRTLYDEDQRARHGLAWVNNLCAAIRQSRFWGLRLAEAGCFGEVERVALSIGLGEYLAHVTTGMPMSQLETPRPADLGNEDAALAAQRGQDLDHTRASADLTTVLDRSSDAEVQADISMFLAAEPHGTEETPPAPPCPCASS